MAEIYQRSMLLILLFIFSGSSFAQSTGQLFSVASLPGVIHYKRETLNSELAPLKNRPAVLAFIRSRNFPPAKIIIAVRKDSLNSLPWLINTSGISSQAEDEKILLQSKDIPTSRITDPADFRQILQDTLLLIDSLGLDLAIRDQNFPSRSYVLKSGCFPNFKKEALVPLSSNRLVFLPRLIQPCPGNITYVKLYNKGTPERTLATFYISFLDAEQKQLMLDWAAFERKSHPGLSLKGIAESLQNFASNNFGRMSYDQLIDWLQITLH